MISSGMRKITLLTGLLLAGVATAGLAPSAQAFPPAGTPITVNPGPLGASGVWLDGDLRFRGRFRYQRPGADRICR